MPVKGLALLLALAFVSLDGRFCFIMIIFVGFPKIDLHYDVGFP